MLRLSRFLSQTPTVRSDLSVRLKTLRIDSFISKTSSLSRSKCALAIDSALVGVNGTPVSKASYQIYPGIVVDYIRESTATSLTVMRWQNIDIEEIESSKSTGKIYEVTYDLIKNLKIPITEYKDNVTNAVAIEKQVLSTISNSKNVDEN